MNLVNVNVQIGFRVRSRDVKLWDIETLRVIHKLDGSRNVAFSPNGRMLATSGPDGSTVVQLWDTASGKLQQSFSGIGVRPLRSLVFSPDGKILAAGGAARSRRNFVLWDVRTGRELAMPQGHLGSVESIAFSPNGAIVGTGFTGFVASLSLRTPY